ncbi:hypothetical protein MAR_033008 [Mya arenaria]|uniref:Uncharacterized protein n=1 Tax=Mya arenaria TaxID=6604 RepID=A0ABY7GBX6_MYAAR|nr:keratin-associated protein 10-10-like [Mya arenaria]WAR30466.1 hypothetical protein MAR_033008 [Mya arenaria]
MLFLIYVLAVTGTWRVGVNGSANKEQFVSQFTPPLSLVFCSGTKCADTDRSVHQEQPVSKCTPIQPLGFCSETNKDSADNSVLQEPVLNVPARNTPVSPRSSWDNVCAKICNWWSCTTYVCHNGVCCTPGSPKSKCCPYSHPVCIADRYCCKKGYSKVCGGKTCCKKNTNCCGSNCCTYHQTCCGTNACCNRGDKCCKDSLGHRSCCDEKHTFCCEQLGCKTLCPSIFDAVPCNGDLSANIDSQSETYDFVKADITSGSPKVLYRLLRKTEIPARIVAKDAGSTKRVQSHVLCGSRKKYVSQYISTTTDLQCALRWYHTSLNGGIVKIDVSKLPKTARIIDLTDPNIRKRDLTNPKADYFAARMNEVLVALPKGASMSGKIIYPPRSKDKEYV